MLLKELLEAQPKKTAVIAWGRMNPPTIGHQKVVDTVKATAQKVLGEPILFLTKTQDAKKNPLSFAEKIHFASEMFNIPINRNTSVKTIIQALQLLQGEGYRNVVIVAGSDRVQQYQDLVDKYNNKPDKSGEVPFRFDAVKVVSSGERDPDDEGVAGMSASKLRQLASEGNFEGFKQGIPGNETLAQQMYNRVRQAMGINEEAAGVGIITKQNTTKDVKKGTLKKMMKGYKLI
jgi:hypothetical protein